MNRPIKFRAWGGEKVKYFVYFDLMGEGTESDRFIADEAADDEFGGLPTLAKEEIIAVQQFTGLLDKNGKEIYEGDVVCGDGWGKTFASVIFENGTFKTNNILDADLWRINKIEIIGNIYENPELIK